MYLFKGENEKEFKVACKLCLVEIKFTITAEDYKNTQAFPIKIEDIHGSPKHKLIIMIDKNLEVSGFEIEGAGDNKEISYSKELTRQVLSEIDLNDDEIDLYFRTTGRDAVSLGEMSILINKSKEECQVIAAKFVEKGIFKEILGAQPHYIALPPYAALVSQLERFHTYISNIKEEAPKQLNESFKHLEAQTVGVKQLTEYTDFIIELKNTTLKQMFTQKKEFDNTISDIEKINEVTQVISNLEDDSKEILGDQIKTLKGQFEEILKQIYQIMQNHIAELTQEFVEVQNQISINLKKLRLGVVHHTVEQVIQKVFTAKLKQIKSTLNSQLKTIQQAFVNGLKETIMGFNSQFLTKLKASLNAIVEKVNTITESTAKSGETIKKVFADVSKDFSKTVLMAEEKLEGISESIFESFGVLRGTFTSRVIESLDTELGKVMERLEISKIATNEFWEQAKQVSLFTMQSIFFIRSIESAKAHINDEISKAKMRVLIIAPEITDIDIEKLKAVPKHVNIRIAANINISIPEHMDLILEIDEIHNITYRSREMKNLWGINRDYEAVILSVVSETEIDGMKSTEIAGIGSIIEEHIKIFVPVLEEAWIGAHKDIERTIDAAAAAKITFARHTPTPIKEESPISLPKPSRDLEPLPMPPPISRGPEPLPTPTPALHAERPSVQELLKTTTTQPTSPPSMTSGGGLVEEYGNIMNNMEKLTGSAIGVALTKFVDNYTRIEGYSGVLKQISISAGQVSGIPTILPPSQIKELRNKFNFWKKKLGI